MCTLSAQSSICILLKLCDAQEPSKCAVLYRLKHSGRAALSCCKGLAWAGGQYSCRLSEPLLVAPCCMTLMQQVSMKCLADQSRLEA